MREALEQRPWLLPLALVICVLVAYLPSLSGGFLNYDDPWLIEHNAVLANGSPRALSSIWFDLSREGRLALGAEYLPVRDLSLWLEARVFGLSPRPLRLAQLGFFIAGCLAFRRALLAALGRSVAAEAAAWLFALHPVHVESVAWLAGRKDVLAFALVGAALAAYASPSRRVVWATPVLLALAYLSKSMTVTAGGLLLAHDLLVGRRPRWKVLGVTAAFAVGALALHLHVGNVVGMTQLPHGGGRLATAATMGVVWVRYLAHLAWPLNLSIAYDVQVLSGFTALSVFGWLTLLGWGIAGVVLWRARRGSLPLAAWLWFAVPLLPVSHVLFPLQNIMADRYLFLSAMVPALALGVLAANLGRAGIALSIFAIAVSTWLSTERAALFGNSVALFRDAAAKTQQSRIAPYQLATALEAAGDDTEARAFYEETLRRDGALPQPTEEGRRATNNLARLLVKADELAVAESVLRKGRARWPDDPKILANLVRVTTKQGRLDEARRLFDELERRFPDWKPNDTPEKAGP